MWSSPLIVNNLVYIGSHEGQLFCFDLYTGKRLNNFQAGGVIFSAPVVKDSLLYFGCDDGYLYALKPAKYTYPALHGIKKFVYWEPGINNYFRNGTDVTVREYLAARNYAVSDGKKIATWMSKQDSAVNSVIVFASNYFPEEITKGYEQSLLRKYLQNGLSSAWVKKYHRAMGSGLVQIWVHPDGESNLNYIERVAEFGLGEN